MIHIARRLEAEFPWLHTRSGTEEDFHSACERNGVTVVFRHLGGTEGVYVLASGMHFIFLDPTLRSFKLLYVMFHELGHFFFHSPTQSNLFAKQGMAFEWFTRHAVRRNDIEAEQCAAMVLFPMSAIDEAYHYGAVELLPDVRKLIRIRLECQKFLR